MTVKSWRQDQGGSLPCRAEFIIEPFEEGSPGPHVLAAIDAVRALGFEPEMGPFGTSIDGDSTAVINAVQEMLETARRSGATRISLHLDMDTEA
jgi:uncharacterized protein YqgV (UPF0045/DUF77 family)